MSDSAGPTHDTPSDSGQPADAAETFELAPEPPSAANDPSPMVPPVVAGEPPNVPENRQFSLAELLVLVALLALLLSMASSLARWMGWANSPVGLAAVFAGVFGVGTLMGMIFLAFSDYNERAIARLALWVMLGTYILCSACAAFLSK